MSCTTADATFKRPTMGPDGIELTFALNHLEYFPLTTVRLDLVGKRPGARVVSTSSSMQARGKLDLAKTPTSLERSHFESRLSLRGEPPSRSAHASRTQRLSQR